MSNIETIEARKADYEIARDALREAQDAAREAQKAYHDAILDATGLRGHVVEYTDTRGWGSRQRIVTQRFVVEKLGSWNVQYVRGPIVKKDGSIGERELQSRIEDVRDCGPFEAAS